MWNRRDWDDFFDIVRKRWHTHRPPRPLDRSGRRLTPAEGYSLAELDDAGMSIEQAEILGTTSRRRPRGFIRTERLVIA